MAEPASSAAKNIAAMMGAQVVTWASTFLLMIVLPRYLGSEDFGRLYLAMSLGMMAQVFVEFGGSFFVAKEVARDRTQAGALIADSIGLRFILSLAAIAMCMLFAVAAGYSREILLLIAILVTAKFWEGALGVAVGAFQGFERLEFRSVTSIVERVFLSLVAVTGILLGGRSVFVALTMAASTLLSTIVGFRLLRRLLTSFPAISWRACVVLGQKGLPYLMMSIFAVIYFRINMIMLSLYTPAVVVGWFGAAFRFFDILMFLPTIVSLALFPILSRIAVDPVEVVRTAQRGVEMLLLAAIPTALGTYAFADVIIRLLFGAQEFSGSVPVLHVLSGGIPIIYVNFILVATLVAVDKQRAWSFVALGAIPVSIGLNALFIPLLQSRWANGGIGSAWATVLTEGGIMIFALWLLSPYQLPGRLANKLWRILGASVAMAAAIWGLRVMGLPWVVQALGGVLLYGVAVVMLGAMSREDRTMLWSMVSPRQWKQFMISRTETV